MKPLMNKFRLCAVVAVAALTAASAFASAPHTPRSLKDLLEKNADWGSEQLRSRGYTRISSDRHHGKVVQYWWSYQKNRCIRAEAWDRDYHSIMTTSSTDCHQYHDEATKDDSSAGVAIAAAAIIGAAVLASSSHHRDDETNRTPMQPQNLIVATATDCTIRVTTTTTAPMLTPMATRKASPSGASQAVTIRIMVTTADTGLVCFTG